MSLVRRALQIWLFGLALLAGVDTRAIATEPNDALATRCDAAISALRFVAPKDAIVACDAAVRAHPTDARFLLQLGRAYLTDRNAGEARRALEDAASLGEGAAMVEMAAALFNGKVFAADRKAACDWYDLASKVGMPAGLNGVGICFEHGFGRRKDQKASIEWFERAADAGSFVAYSNLIRFSDRGIGGARDPERAGEWMVKALDRGHEAFLNDLVSYPSGWSRDARRALQRRLKEAGTYDGPLDGFMNTAFDQAVWSRARQAGTSASPRLAQSFAWAPIDGAPKGLLVRVCGPADAAPNVRRPLVVINHGLTTVDTDRRDMRPMACGATARFFVERGYIVAMPLRRGYGETRGPFVEGGTQICATSRDFTEPGLAIADDIQATIREMRKRPDVAATDAVIVGHSGGGWGALALASRNASGIAGHINLSGVHGSNRGRPDGVCGPEPIVRSAKTFGKTARQPTLWIYAENDSHAGPRLVRRMLDGYKTGGGAATLEMLPPYDTDGHNLFDDDGLETWAPAADRWLKSLKSR